jgi:hypothetical protein
LINEGLAKQLNVHAADNGVRLGIAAWLDKLKAVASGPCRVSP